MKTTAGHVQNVARRCREKGQLVYEQTFADIHRNLHTKFSETSYSNDDMRLLMQSLCIAEEAGELVKEMRLYLNMGRRPGSILDVGRELADVYITVRMLAEMLGLDLMHEVGHKLGIIVERGGV